MILNNPLPSASEQLDALIALVEKDLLDSQAALQENLETQLPWMPQVIQSIMDTSRPPLRVLMLSLSARMFSYAGQKIPHISSVLEYLNMAANIHQNIILTEEIRRKQAALSSIWGNEASVLLGDYLLAISFKTMTRLGDFELLDTISMTTQSIARGQILSISPFSWEGAEAHILEILRHRNASLYRASAKSGAILGQADKTTQQALKDYGLFLGLGIQLIKDLETALDPQKLREHLKNQLLCFPLGHLMVKMHHQGEELLLKKLLEQPTFSETQVQILHSYFQQYQVFEYTRQQIDAYLNQSEAALNTLTHLDISPLLRLNASIRQL